MGHSRVGWGKVRYSRVQYGREKSMVWGRVKQSRVDMGAARMRHALRSRRAAICIRQLCGPRGRGQYFSRSRGPAAAVAPEGARAFLTNGRGPPCAAQPGGASLSLRAGRQGCKCPRQRGSGAKARAPSATAGRKRRCLQGASDDACAPRDPEARRDASRKASGESARAARPGPARSSPSRGAAHGRARAVAPCAREPCSRGRALQCAREALREREPWARGRVARGSEGGPHAPARSAASASRMPSLHGHGCDGPARWPSERQKSGVRVE